METDDLPDDLLTLAEAARLARASPSSVYRWTRTGRLRGWVRTGGVVFVSAAEVRGLFRAVRPPRQPGQRTLDAAARREHERAVEALRRAGWG
jgi:hypothetical protein